MKDIGHDGILIPQRYEDAVSFEFDSLLFVYLYFQGMRMSPTNNKPAEPLSLKQNMFWNSIGSLFYLACQWLITVLVVRLSSGFDSAGLLSLATSVVGTFGTLADYKIFTYQISDIHHENSLREYIAFRCVTIGVAFAVCFAYSLLTCPPYSIVTIILYYAYKSVGLVIDILHGTDQQHRRMDYTGKSFILQGVVSIVGFTLVFSLTGNLNLAILSMMFLVLGVLFLYDCPRAGQFESLGFSISRAKVLRLFRTSLPAVIASVAASAIFTIPKQYLLSSYGDAALGIYSSIAAPALVVQMGAQYLYGPLLDIFPKHFLDGRMSDFNHLLKRTALSIVAVAIICCAGVAIVGEPLLVLVFGESIRPHVYLLQPVLVSTTCTAFLWFFGDLLITIRDFRANFLGNVLALVAVIPLSIVCINFWGMNGVSFASAGACLVGIAILGISLRRDAEKQVSGRRDSGA